MLFKRKLINDTYESDISSYNHNRIFNSLYRFIYNRCFFGFVNLYVFSIAGFSNSDDFFVLKDYREYPANYDPRSWPLE